MTNNSPVFWEANSFSLHTLAWSVKSFGGKRFFGPDKRGEDLSVPFRRGRIYRRKSRESQVYSLNMWVIPVGEDGNPDPVLTREQKAHENWRRIVAALDVEGQFPLVKRWYDGSDIVAATAMAEFMSGDGPATDDGTGFYGSLKLMLADPYFYRPVAIQAIPDMTVIEGEAPTDHATLFFTGGTNPKLTTADGNWVRFNGTVGTPVEIDLRWGNAKQGSTYVNGLVTRNPNFQEWPMLDPAGDPPVITGGAGTLEYEAAYR